MHTCKTKNPRHKRSDMKTHTGDKVTNLMELTSDGGLKTTTKKGNGVNIRVMKVVKSMISIFAFESNLSNDNNDC